MIDVARPCQTNCVAWYLDEGIEKSGRESRRGGMIPVRSWTDVVDAILKKKKKKIV